MQKQIPSSILTYLLLSHLSNGPSYGYRMVKALEEQSNGHWTLSYGTVYGSLARMERGGLIEKCPESGTMRKYYRITSKGISFQREQAHEISDMADQTREMILGFLNVYHSLYGDVKLETLVDSIEKEFSKERKDRGKPL